MKTGRADRAKIPLVTNGTRAPPLINGVVMTKHKSYEDYSLDELYDEINRIDKKADPDNAKRILDEITDRHEATNRAKSEIREAEQRANSGKKEEPGVFSGLSILAFSVFILWEAYHRLSRGTAFLEYDPFSLFSPQVKFGFQVFSGVMLLALSLWVLKQKFTDGNGDA